MKTKRLLNNLFAAIAALFISMLPMAAQTGNDSQKFPLWVCGTQVTTDNMEGISGPGISGIVKYDPRMATLTLQKSTLTATDVEAVKSQVEGLVIDLHGPNFVIHSSDGSQRKSHAMSFEAETVITGSDLDVKTTTAHCAAMAIAPQTKVSLKGGCRVNLQGYWGVLGDTLNRSSWMMVSRSSLAINKQAINIDSDMVIGSSVSGLSDLVLDSCAIIEPTGSWFYARRGYVADADGNAVRGRLIVDPVELYGIRVAGIEVHSHNFENITGPCIEGNVSFKLAEKTLYIDHAEIKHAFHPAIEFYGHTITRSYRLYAGSQRNVLRGLSTPALLSSVALYIIGPGLIEAYADTTAAICQQFSMLTIDQSRVTAKGRYGILGVFDGNYHTTLALRQCTVSATGYDGSITKISAMSLDGCEIVKPEGGCFEPRAQYVANADGTLATGEVLVRPITTAIQAIPVTTSDGRGEIYSLQGIRMNTSKTNSPKGIYIYKGKKVVEK